MAAQCMSSWWAAPRAKGTQSAGDYLITEKMISEPKHVDELYEELPKNYRKAIEKRDAP
jgi:hypothetical protein